MFLADVLGNFFVACALVGAVAWAGVIAHFLGYITLPKREK